MNPDVKNYLIHSYLYYVLDESIISDSEYDLLCKKLLSADINHPLISKENLIAGTGFNIKEYPQEIIDEAKELLENTPKSEPAAVRTYEQKPMVYNNSPIETYLLLGMYIDYGLAQQRNRQKEIQVELQSRWNAGIHHFEFQRYFRDHMVSPERFNLV